MSKLSTLRNRKFVQQDGRCYYCDQPMWDRAPQKFAATYRITTNQARLLKLTAEHLLPRCDGGSNTVGNIVAACAYCNGKRHKRKIPMEPNQYQKHVRTRLADDAWHGLRIIAAG